VNAGLLLLIITVVVALTFDFLNGFHDAANSIATVVSTRVLTPRKAVLLAAFCNFIAAWFLGTAVAKTIGKGMIRLEDVTQYVVIAGLAGPADFLVARIDWGLRGRGRGTPCLKPRHRQRFRRHHPRRLDQDPHLHRNRANDRAGLGSAVHHGELLADA